MECRKRGKKLIWRECVEWLKIWVSVADRNRSNTAYVSYKLVPQNLNGLDKYLDTQWAVNATGCRPITPSRLQQVQYGRRANICITTDTGTEKEMKYKNNVRHKVGRASVWWSNMSWMEWSVAIGLWYLQSWFCQEIFPKLNCRERVVQFDAVRTVHHLTICI